MSAISMGCGTSDQEFRGGAGAAEASSEASRAPDDVSDEIAGSLSTTSLSSRQGRRARNASGSGALGAGSLTNDLLGVVQDEFGAPYYESEIVAGLKAGVTPAELQAAVGPFDIQVVDETSLLSSRLGYVRLMLPEGLSQDEAGDILAGIEKTRSVERHYLYQINVIPNDPGFGSLWGLEKIQAPDAWEVVTGTSSVAVMVADTGISLNHADLLDNLGFTEFDSSDSFEDDSWGWDFVDDDNFPDDSHGHGTHVAGTIGAVGNDGQGVPGINWDVELVAARVCGGRSCSTWAAAEALLYAAQRGVRVVNMSLGGYHPELSYEKSALLAAGDAGSVVVCAAGNDARNTDVYRHYPSSYDFDFLISVAATDEEDRLASFSNYGSSTVHLGAPGTNIVSTLPGGGHGAKSGTSMAAPHVAGAAAVYVALHPESTPQEVRQALLGSVQPLGTLSGLTTTGGRLDLAQLVGYEPPNRCGDGIIRGQEACDDGNLEPWDGCSPTCQWEPRCPSNGGSCSSTCGDGMTLPGDDEECDDGNVEDGDGCSARCEVEAGYECSSEVSTLEDTLSVPVVFRDFNHDPKSGGTRHPDFEEFSGTDRTPGLVATRLDEASGLPVYTGLCEAGAITGSCPHGAQSSSLENFDSWYRTTEGVNHALSTTIALARQIDDSFVYKPSQLFPVDGFGFVERNQERTSGGHNFGFTTEIRRWFRYEGGERLEFTGDDDLWVFVNGRLALDLGGLHPERSGVLELSDSRGCETVRLEGGQSPTTEETCRELAIAAGEVYQIALFHAERHTDRSNFKLTLRGFAMNPSACELAPCPEGYQGGGLDCVDEDECESGQTDCDANATCENTDGSYLCHCPDGLVGDGINCEDRDECQDGSAQCPEGASCVNLVGSYRCEGGQTTFPPPDVDECALRLDSCDDNATCTNTDGSYTCRCNEGYFGNGFFCDDLDECTSGLNSCDPHASCTNEIGGFDCSCEVGWLGDGFTCEDEDECAQETDECDSNADCENLVGSYACSCQDGYAGDGFSCQDEDECALGLHDCGQNADCQNEPGTFSCTCSSGYQGDGTTCSLIPITDPGSGGSSGAGGETGTGGASASGGASQGAGGEASTGGASSAGGGPGGSTGGAPSSGGQAGVGEGSGGAEGAGGATGQGGQGAGGETGSGGQPAGSGASGGASGSAGGGDSGPGNGSSGGASGQGGAEGDGGASGSGGSVHVPTCAEEDPCSEEATCHDSESGPECVCNEGFDGDGLTCDDVDECGVDIDACHENATCQNAWGGYYCNCNPGYYGDGELCLMNPGFVLQVVSSSDHTCALLEGGSVRCWGFNEYGQLGYGDTETTGDNERADVRGYVNVGAEVVQVETGFAHTCALTAAGEVRCWGRNLHGQLGLVGVDQVGDDELPVELPAVDVGGTVVQLAAGGEHTCALLDTGAVRCWGLGIDGQLGYGNPNDIGDDEPPSSAGNVPLGGSATSITAGRDHTCALLQGGEVMCWGRGLWGPTGYGHTRNIGDDETPQSAGSVPLGAPAVAIDAGWYHTCAIVEQGGSKSLRCFGYGGVGQLGYASTQSVGDDEPPADFGDVELGFEPHTVTAGLYHTCATNSIGEAICFGYGQYGRLGYANEEDIGDDEHPAVLPMLNLSSRVISIAAGAEHTCATLNSGNVRCWGSAAYGQLGTGSSEDIGDDEYPDGTLPILESDVDECLLGTHSCDPVAVCSDLTPGYRCTCPRGYEGDGFSCFPLENVVLSVAAGDAHTCAIVTTGEKYFAGAQSGSVRCWGNGGAGRLGLSSTTSVGDNELPSSVLPVDLGDDAVQLALGGSHSCALLSSGGVRCWGSGTRGQLGIAVSAIVGDDEAPAEVSTVLVGGPVEKIVAGIDHTCALLDGGSVRCWGEGDAGRLGYGTEDDVGKTNHPAQVGDVALGGTAVDLAAGDYHTCALLEATEHAPRGIRCWGAGTSGRLGHQSNVAIGDDETPDSWPLVELGGPAVALSAGGNHTCALMADATLRCFGYGFHGALGYGSYETIGDDEPVFAGGLLAFEAPVLQVVTGRHHTCALLGDGAGQGVSRAGTVQCWGYGPSGALGLGSEENVGDEIYAALYPAVNLGGFVFELAAGGQHTCARLSDGIKCWGNSSFGQLGYGTRDTIGITDEPANHPVVSLFE